MARGKHSIALFEVITADRAQQRHASPLSRRARWWFQRPASQGGQSAQAVIDNDDAPIMREVSGGPTAEEIAADPTLRPISSPMRIETPVIREPDPEPVVAVAVPEDHEPVVSYRGEETPAPAVVEAEDENSPEVRPARKWRFGRQSAGMDFDLNPDKHEFTLKMGYTAGIITAFAVLVVVGLAYVAGRSTGSKAPVLAAGTTSTEQIRKGPVHPTALSVGKRSDEAAINSADRAAINIAQKQTIRTTGKSTTPEKNAVKPTPQPNDVPAPQPGAIEQTPQRSIGLNYVLVQSYSDAEEANRAVEVLRQAGIPSTIERGLPIAPAKFSVVGTAGFASPFKTKPEYRQYLSAIDHVSQGLTAKSGVRRFEPMCFKWPGAGQG